MINVRFRKIELRLIEGAKKGRIEIGGESVLSRLRLSYRELPPLTLVSF